MPTKVESAKEATFGTDDKRAQYARLAVFNYGVKEKLIPKDKDVNSVSQSDLQKAFKSLMGGTLLEGKGGIEYLQSLTKAGATDEKVAKRGLTPAYAQEVRPFIKKGLLSATFGRRGGGPKPAKKAAPKASGKPKASAKKSAPKPEAAAA